MCSRNRPRTSVFSESEHENARRMLFQTKLCGIVVYFRYPDSPKVHQSPHF